VRSGEDRDLSDVRAGRTIRPNPTLIAEGWKQRNVSGPDRTDELRRLYESLGFDVRIEKLDPRDFGSDFEDCESCAVVACTSYVVIYTRKRASVP